MDWLKLVTTLLLLIVINGEAVAAARKKIRIHVPQQVQHIHHHKKVYITKLSEPITPLSAYTTLAGPPSYAPAFLASEPAPAIALVPVSEARAGPPGLGLGLQYRARGHYGPPTVTRVQKPRSTKSNPTKRVKIVTTSEPKRKKTIKKRKTKRIVIHEEPRKKLNEITFKPGYNDEISSDMKTNKKIIKKYRKPKRVEKYNDGNTEHIHTYSEEHIHQIVYDNPGKNGKGEGLESTEESQVYVKPNVPPTGQIMAPLDADIQHSIRSSPSPSPASSTLLRPVIVTDSVPSSARLRPHDTLLPIIASDTAMRDIEALTSYRTVGSMGTPAHMEYMDYNPHEASHEHHYHNHGKLYMNNAFNKHSKPPIKIALNHDIQKKVKPSKSTPINGKESWISMDYQNKGEDSEETPSYLEVANSGKKSNNLMYPKYPHDIAEIINTDYSLEEPTEMIYESKKKQIPVKSLIKITFNRKRKPKPIIKKQIHRSLERKPKSTFRPITEDFGLYKDMDKDLKHGISNEDHLYYGAAIPVQAFVESQPYGYSLPSQYQFETTLADQDKDLFVDSRHNNFYKTHSAAADQIKKKAKKQSVSMQNMRFGGQAHKSIVNHVAEGLLFSPTMDTYFDSSEGFSTEDSKFLPSENQFRVMESKAFDESMQEASNTNMQIVEAPAFYSGRPIVVETTTSTEAATQPTSTEQIILTTTPRPKIYKIKSTTKETKSQVKKSDNSRSSRGNLKYGDRFNGHYTEERVITSKFKAS